MSIQPICLVPDCLRTRAPHAILCDECWSLLPSDIRHAVWTAWNRDPDAEKAREHAARVAHDYFRTHSMRRSA